MSKLTVTVTIVAAGIAAAIGLAAPASADTTTDAYLTILENRGIYAEDGDAHLISAGLTVCDMLDDGNSLKSVGMTVYRNTDLSAASSGYLVGASIAAFCPQYEVLLPGLTTAGESAV